MGGTRRATRIQHDAPSTNKLACCARILFLSLFSLLLVGLVGFIRHSDFFVIKSVKVAGKLSKVDPVRLQSAIIDSFSGNFLSINLEEGRHQIVKLPWVKQITARRVWPNTIALTITENQPLAKWGQDKVLLDDGELLPASLDIVTSIPSLSGPQSSEHLVLQNYQSFKKQLNQLNMSISSLQLGDHGEWQLCTDQGACLKLGSDHLAQRLARFIELYPTLTKDSSKSMQEADLRYTNGIAVRWK